MGQDTDIAIADSVIVFISYYDMSRKNLKLAILENNKWTIEVVDSEGSVGMYTSIAVDSNGDPHISYADTGGVELLYAHRMDSGWDIDVADSNGRIYESTSVAIDSNDNPHICYYASTPTSDLSLKYAYLTNKWNVEEVDSNLWRFNQARGTTIAMDKYDRTHMAYFSWRNWDLKYAYRANNKWNVEVVDSEGDVGAYPSVAIDLNGYPHISYMDRSNLNLKRARRIPYDPEIPDKPSGSIYGIVGREYAYTTSAIDFDGDKIKYGWDWDGDKIVDEWTFFL